MDRMEVDQNGFRTASGTKLTTAVDSAVVGCQVDRVDHMLKSG